MKNGRTDSSEAQPRRPTNDDPDAWRTYWKALGQSWRTEPEIDEERKEALARRRAITPDPDRGEYPFKGVELGRRDVEWLLATHDDGRGPVYPGVERFQLRRDEHRQGLDLRGATLWADLSHLPLSATHLEDATLVEAHLEGANLWDAHLQDADLQDAHLERADLGGAYLGSKNKMSHGDLERIHKWIGYFPETLLAPDLRGAFFDAGTDLSDIRLCDDPLGSTAQVGPQVADLRWGGVNLAVVNWEAVLELGDDQSLPREEAVRANRQLAVALREQGMNEVADRFFYRSQVLQLKVFRRQHQWKQYLFSLFSWALAGYGYRPWRTFGWYLGVVVVGSLLYWLLGMHYSDALVGSITAFHGRGLFQAQLTDWEARVAAVEAFLGLVIEVAFIVTFTQRFFGR